ncbi:F-box/kelch-repeat protein At5g15710-like [Tasmannia lanceolata]|uniref:F-box/kelch-repeat protein At5g15710-like n=1 Tax=Tasmannia lanceolata TaxID=3420 RepID=UPI0040636BB6
MEPILISVPTFSCDAPSDWKIGTFRATNETENSERMNWKIGTLIYQKEEEKENSEIDERIWSRIPEEMIITVLSSLPLAAIFRATLLSKSFKSTIFSTYFLKLHSELSPDTHQPWFVILSRNLADSFLAYDPCLNKWIDLSFRFLPFPVRPITASDGLICLTYGTESNFRLCVCNPISRSHNIIPKPLIRCKPLYILPGLFVDRINGFFRLVFVLFTRISKRSELLRLFAEVYDSRTQLWYSVKSFPVSSPLSPSETISNGVMYFILDRFPVSMVAFNIKTMKWVMLKAPFPHSLTIVKLMEHKGRLVMIGGLGTEGLIDEIGIWQLDNSSQNWKRIGRIPKEVCDLFLISECLACTGHGDLIYFTIKGYPFVVMYDISRKYLKVLDPSPRLLDPQSHESLGFFFEPRLH